VGKPESNRLRVLRAEQRVTQLTLSRKAHINPSRISFIENGHVEPTPEERAKLAKALRVTESELGFELPTEATQ